jgi:hypothetical protein
MLPMVFGCKFKWAFVELTPQLARRLASRSTRVTPAFVYNSSKGSADGRLQSVASVRGGLANVSISGDNCHSSNQGALQYQAAD